MNEYWRCEHLLTQTTSWQSVVNGSIIMMRWERRTLYLFRCFCSGARHCVESMFRKVLNLFDELLEILRRQVRRCLAAPPSPFSLASFQPSSVMASSYPSFVFLRCHLGLRPFGSSMGSSFGLGKRARPLRLQTVLHGGCSHHRYVRMEFEPCRGWFW